MKGLDEVFPVPLFFVAYAVLVMEQIGTEVVAGVNDDW